MCSPHMGRGKPQGLFPSRREQPCPTAPREEPAVLEQEGALGNLKGPCELGPEFQWVFSWDREVPAGSCCEALGWGQRPRDHWLLRKLLPVNEGQGGPQS